MSLGRKVGWAVATLVTSSLFGAACGSTANVDTSASADPDGSVSDRDGSTSLPDDAQADSASAPLDGSASHDAALCATCARDWTQYPAIAQIAGGTELWALSDVHGDYQAFTKLLIGAKLIANVPANPTGAIWTGGAATLMIVGDLIDKGPDAVDVLRFAAALQRSAASAGGAVVVTMGNHEAEFLADPVNSKASGADGIDPELQSAGLTAAATAAGQNDVGAFVQNLPFAAKVGDWFFVHAGKTDGKSIAILESSLETAVNANGFGATALSGADSLLEAKLSAKGPQWWDATGDPQMLLTQWTAALGVKHLVMGHQPGSVGFADKSTRASDQMMQKYGGLLFLIDTGLSVGVDATGGAMLHVKNVGTVSESFEEVMPNGASKGL